MTKYGFWTLKWQKYIDFEQQNIEKLNTKKQNTKKQNTKKLNTKKLNTIKIDFYFYYLPIIKINNIY